MLSLVLKKPVAAPVANMSSMTLGQELKGVQAAMLAQSPDEPKGPLLRKWFTPGEMSALWLRLNACIQAGP
eukprot:1659806-Lingulodinium_polyedra.AAC.1